MEAQQRDVIIDLYIFNHNNKITTVKRDDKDIYEKNVLSPIILTVPFGTHPIKHLQTYLKDKNLKHNQIEILPALYLNQFDTEPEKDYLVLSFKTTITGTPEIQGDKENPNIKWMEIEEFKNHPKLMPEFKRSNALQILTGKPLYYSGYYKESDGSYEVIKWEKY